MPASGERIDQRRLADIGAAGEGDLDPVGRRQVGDPDAAFDESERPGEQQPPGLDLVRGKLGQRYSAGLLVAGFGFRLKLVAMLPKRFTSAPCRFMMNHCWAIDSELFHAQ